nr:MAG TPA: hypothetical protein [Caudoviricetes sp.]
MHRLRAPNKMGAKRTRKTNNQSTRRTVTERQRQ